MNVLLNKCQKTSLRYAVRAAFDTDEKDVRRERCKDTIPPNIIYDLIG